MQYQQPATALEIVGEFAMLPDCKGYWYGIFRQPGWYSWRPASDASIMVYPAEPEDSVSEPASDWDDCPT